MEFCCLGRDKTGTITVLSEALLAQTAFSNVRNGWTKSQNPVWYFLLKEQ